MTPEQSRAMALLMHEMRDKRRLTEIRRALATAGHPWDILTPREQERALALLAERDA